MYYILHFLVPWTQNITLGLDTITLCSPQRTDLSLNVIFLPGCFIKTFINMMLVTLLFYIFTFLFFTCIVFYFPLCYHMLASCNYTVSQKTRHQTLSHNFTNYHPIFKIFSLADSVVKLQQILV